MRNEWLRVYTKGSKDPEDFLHVLGILSLGIPGISWSHVTVLLVHEGIVPRELMTFVEQEVVGVIGVQHVDIHGEIICKRILLLHFFKLLKTVNIESIRSEFPNLFIPRPPFLDNAHSVTPNTYFTMIMMPIFRFGLFD